MKKYLSLFLLVLPYVTNSQTRLTADGPGNTYDLIKSVLAPGYNPIEVPDCNHTDFGNHIDEVFDSTLNTNVFRFYIHSTPDNDRCIKFDRQRNEIKTYDKSPSDLKGTQGEIVVYKWGFKLENGFQSSPNFTHIHQLKSVGGALESMPMYTLTTRKGSPDKIQIRYAETDAQVTVYETEKSNEQTTKETLKWVHIAISNAKRNFVGNYHKIKKKYLQLYLNEFVYKLNLRYFGERIFERLVIANITAL